MTHDYQEAKAILTQHNAWRRGDDNYTLCDVKELGVAIDTAIHALELAIALQPKPISEAAIGQWVLTYNPMAELVREKSYEVSKLTRENLFYAHPRTHFYDISALPKPEVTE